MMVPDYALISEISLYSSGYLKARDLARKLVATYRYDLSTRQCCFDRHCFVIVLYAPGRAVVPAAWNTHNELDLTSYCVGCHMYDTGCAVSS